VDAVNAGDRLREQAYGSVTQDAEPSLLDEIAVALEEGIPMRCDFEKLWLYLNKELDLDTRLEVLEHLEHCKICFETLYRMARDRDVDLFVPYALKDRLAS
jgi:hypothetical protein